ncbi:MAG: transcriptional repressor LexA [Spirochaetes bacterium]|nr:transcriptional repressor LexA [Spirochaetota bacterium]
MKEMTKKQKEVYDFIRSKITRQGFPPTVREIGHKFSISVKGAYDHLKAIERKGFIRCATSKSRAIEILDKVSVVNDLMIRVPLLGRVAAGLPLLADEFIEEEFLLPRSLLGESDLFALRVKGDSMIDAGIHDGDLALIRMQSFAYDGDIIVALIEDETTVKKFYHEESHIRLQPANDSYKPIIVNNVEIVGKVVWVFRKIS